MPDDWEWFWSSEQGRTRMLRDELEGLQGVASQAHAQASRLSSQLATLQGSLDSRLTALSTAFDAYVELGDVRESLAGYPDTSAIRRDAAAAIQVLGRGGVPEPVEDRGVDYWLPDAVNAVAGLVQGSPQPELEARAVARSRDAELFIVAAAAALGHGADVASRVPALLIADGPLSQAQLAIWAAVRTGLFGPGVWAGVGEQWRSALSTDAEDWTSWVLDTARTNDAHEGLSWMDQLTAGTTGGPAEPGSPVPAEPPVPADQLQLGTTSAAVPAPAPTPTAGDEAANGLRALMLRLLNSGLGDEVALLQRARVLRATIEHPTAPPLQESEAPDESHTITTEVRTAFLAAGPGSPVRAELFGWLRPGLLLAVPVLVDRARSATVETVRVQSLAGSFEVSPAGADPARVERNDQLLVQRYTVPSRSVLLPAVVAGALALVGVVMLLIRVPALGVLALIAAAIAAVVALVARSRRATAARRLAEDRAATRATLTEGQQRAQELDRVRRDAVAGAERLAASLSGRLDASPS